MSSNLQDSHFKFHVMITFIFGQKEEEEEEEYETFSCFKLNSEYGCTT